jgi:hypothetical protein
MGTPDSEECHTSLCQAYPRYQTRGSNENSRLLVGGCWPRMSARVCLSAEAAFQAACLRGKQIQTAARLFARSVSTIRNTNTSTRSRLRSSSFGSAVHMRKAAWLSILPRQSPSSLIFASISWEGDWFFCDPLPFSLCAKRCCAFVASRGQGLDARGTKPSQTALTGSIFGRQ